MIRFIFLILVSAVMSSSIFAETEATTIDGKKVILKENGTWEYPKTSTIEPTTSSECSDLISIKTEK